MNAKQLEIIVDYRTIALFVESTLEAKPTDGFEVLPSDEIDASRLLIMLASIGEFRVFTTASQLERLCENLSVAFSDECRIKRIISKLETVVEVLPTEQVHVDGALNSKDCQPLDLKVLEAVAASSGIAVVVSPEGALSPTGFFKEVKRRYGFDYAELKMKQSA